MLAERFPSAHIEAWEVETAACRDAAANIEASPYASRLTLREVNYLDAVKAFASSQHTGFDLIVSNPPYFIEDVLSPNEQRQLARHAEADGLSPETLLRHASGLLSSSGSLALITPSALLPSMRRIATESLLRLSELAYIYTSPNRLIRVITLWRKLSLCEPYTPTHTTHFTLLDVEGKPSETHRSLLSDFLLDS
jgi:tRNA (adenine-N(6)-)-methyltransferase